MAANTKEALLREVSTVFCEFLEAATHTLLYIRNVYPPEIFERRRKYNVPVRQSRHKDLNDYITGAVADVKQWMDKGPLNDETEHASRDVQERFVFEVDVDVTGQARSPTKGTISAHSQAELEDALKQVLLKINVADSIMPPLRKDITFSIYVHTPTTVPQATDNWESMATEEGAPRGGRDGAGGGGVGGQGAILPLKSVQAGALRMQLYAQSYDGHAR